MNDEEFVKQLEEIDARFQARLKNQVNSINRILLDGTYTTEMDALHAELAATQVALDQAERRIAELEETTK